MPRYRSPEYTMPKSASRELTRRRFSTEPAETMFDTWVFGIVRDRCTATPLEKYWKVPPSGPPEKPRRVVWASAPGEAVSVTAATAATARLPKVAGSLKNLRIMSMVSSGFVLL
jgi:hypothetical protein